VDTAYHLRVENGVLQYSIKDGQGWARMGKDGRARPLQPTFPDGFFNSAWQFVFQRDAQGKISGFTPGAPWGRNLIFARQNR